MRSAVFLDRDGVINEIVLRNGALSAPYAVSEFKILDGVREAMRLLKTHGFLRVVVTNQPDLGRGRLREQDLTEIHDLMRQELEIDAVYICPHSHDGECQCKKPMPGMVHAATKDHGVDLSKSWLVGDRWRDIHLAKRTGIRSILIGTAATRLDTIPMTPDHTATNLLEAVRIITGS